MHRARREIPGIITITKEETALTQQGAVIFDLDGTLLDTLEDLADSANFALTAHGFPRRSLGEVRQFVGNGVRELIRRAVPEGTPPQELERCLAEFKAHYLHNMQNKTRPYPGILELLAALRAQGRPLAVVSNKFDGAVKGLCRDYFGDLLPVALGESPDCRKKPAPDLVFRSLELLQAPAAGAVYVGDSDVDLQTAASAGLPCLSVTWGFRDRQFLLSHGATVLADTPEELLDLLQRPSPLPSP